jgi:hypothetical protein
MEALLDREPAGDAYRLQRVLVGTVYIRFVGRFALCVVCCKTLGLAYTDWKACVMWRRFSFGCGD